MNSEAWQMFKAAAAILCHFSGAQLGLWLNQGFSSSGDLWVQLWSLFSVVWDIPWKPLNPLGDKVREGAGTCCEDYKILGS